jgi:hypothetical protein
MLEVLGDKVVWEQAYILPAGLGPPMVMHAKVNQRWLHPLYNLDCYLMTWAATGRGLRVG